MVRAAPAYWKFIQLYSQIRSRILRLKNKRKKLAFRKASIYSAHYKQMWHMVTPTTLSDTHSWTDFELVRSSAAIASRGTSSHGRSTSVSSRCPENDDNIIRRNFNDKYSHHTAGGPTNTSCRSTQTRLGSTSTSNTTTCSPANTRSSCALKQQVLLQNVLAISEKTLPGAPWELPPHWVVVPQQSLTLIDHKLLISCTC